MVFTERPLTVKISIIFMGPYVRVSSKGRGGSSPIPPKAQLHPPKCSTLPKTLYLRVGSRILEGEGNEELCPGWHCQSGPEKALLTAALDSLWTLYKSLDHRSTMGAKLKK